MPKIIIRDSDPKDQRPIEVWLERNESGSIQLMASHSAHDPEPHYVVAIMSDGCVQVNWSYDRGASFGNRKLL